MPSASDSPAFWMKELRLISDGNTKFWRIGVCDKRLHIQFGRLGADGIVDAKIFPSSRDADETASRLIDTKKEKGYREVTVSKASERAMLEIMEGAGVVAPLDQPAGMQRSTPDAYQGSRRFIDME